MRFEEHALAHELLDGLHGLEIGADSHHPFGLQTRNVAPLEDYEFSARAAPGAKQEGTEMEQTLEQLARVHDNDYTALENRYQEATGGELVRDPYRSPQHPAPEITLTVSVIIPAWNAQDTLEACLIAIEQSSFNRKYPHLLEVIVVDDGSSDGTWDLLKRMRLNLHLKAVRQTHHSRAHTQNTGIAIAEGDVLVSCDADMILTPFSLEELVKRHEVLEDVMLIGFRANVAVNDPRIQPAALPAALPHMPPPFGQDIRLSYHGDGWPESMCRDSDHLKRLGYGRRMIMQDGSQWDLPGIVYGALFSLPRQVFITMAGYDERFIGWGCEDTLVGVRARALGLYIIPVYAVAGLHIAHGDRSPRKWREFSSNRRIFQTILRAPFASLAGHWLPRARQRIAQQFERAPTPSESYEGDAANALAALEAELADPDRRGKHYHMLGHYQEAADAFSEVRGTAEQEAWALFDRGKALRAGRQFEAALPLLVEACQRLPASPCPKIETALALATQDEFVTARAYLEQARALDPQNLTLNFLLGRPAGHHRARAAIYSQQGDYQLAMQDWEAVLILEPSNHLALTERACARAALDQNRYVMTTGASEPSIPNLEQARTYLAVGQLGAAKATLEHVRRLRANDPELRASLASVQTVAAARHPLLLIHSILQYSQSIPGWFSLEEADLLAALVLRTLLSCGAEQPPVLVEIGSYCGRATLVMARIAQGLGRQDLRVYAVDEPSLGPGPDSRSARDMLGRHLAAQHVRQLVVYAPEDDPEPWLRPSHLLLVDARHDEAGVHSDVARYAPRLLPGGLLLFHDYTDYFPDVQRCIDELLFEGVYEFVAHVGSLIALAKPAEAESEAAPDQNL